MIGIIDVGGGTRGSFGAGVFDYCMDKGIGFDYLIGVSAGSANMASFLANQPRRNLQYYDEYAFRKEYMGLSQLIRTGNFINLDYIYSELSNSDGENPLDYPTLKSNPAELEIVGTNAITGLPEYFSKNDMAQDSYDCIKASCCVPGVNKPYIINGTPYYDGGMSDPIPYLRALNKGCDKLVIILTRPKGYFRNPDKDKKIARLIRRKYPNASATILNRAQVYNKQLKDVLLMEKEGKALIIAPESIGNMKTLTKSHDPIRLLYKQGYEAAEKIPDFIK